MYHKYFKKHVNIKQIEDEFKKKKVHEEGLKWFITTTINCDFAQVIESLCLKDPPLQNELNSSYFIMLLRLNDKTDKNAKHSSWNVNT